MRTLTFQSSLHCKHSPAGHCPLPSSANSQRSCSAAIWNSGCLLYLISPDDSGLPPAPSPLFAALRLVILALVLLPLLLSLSSGARCLSAKAENLSREKAAGVWAATVGTSASCVRLALRAEWRHRSGSARLTACLTVILGATQGAESGFICGRGM